MGKVKRKCKDWLRTYLLYTEEQESPDIFHMWCGISLLAAVLERSVFLDMGYFRVYPNLYIVLVSESATDRKTTAVEMAESIGKTACPDIPFISQKLTPQGLIEELVEVYAEKKVSAGYAVSEELSVLLERIGDSSLVKLLTKGYNCSEIMDYRTIGRGKREAYKVCINMLGATTTDWVRDSLPASAVAGGFAGRIIFIHPGEHTSKRIAIPVLTKQEIQARDDLIHDLPLIRQLSGEYSLSDDGLDWYKTWYETVFQPDKSGSTLGGYYGRKHISVLKIGMILSTSRDGGQVVDEVDLDMAVTMLGEVEKCLPNIMHRIQATQSGDDMLKVLDIIQKKKVVAYSDLLRAISYRLTAIQLNEILLSLITQKRIREEIDETSKRRKRVYHSVVG